MNFVWRDESSNVKHLVREQDGRILGTVWQYVNNNVVWGSKILEDKFPYTNESEKYIGHYIGLEFAKLSVEHYWLKEHNTLIENN
jgi:hypothetical protein